VILPITLFTKPRLGLFLWVVSDLLNLQKLAIFFHFYSCKNDVLLVNEYYYLMKKFFSIFGLLSIFNLTGQGNLQFNQVINLTFPAISGYCGPCSPTIDCNSNDYSSNFTIPDGKVWKIESFGSRTLSGWDVYIDEFRVYTSPAPNVRSYHMAHFPIWLKSGDHFLDFVYVANSPSICSNQSSPVVTLSIIEFNIVP